MEDKDPLSKSDKLSSRKDVSEPRCEAVCTPKTSPLSRIKQTSFVSTAVVSASEKKLFRPHTWFRHTPLLDIEKDLRVDQQTIHHQPFAEPSPANLNPGPSLIGEPSASSVSEANSSSVNTISTLETSDSLPLTQQTSLDHTFTSNPTIVQGFMIDSLSTEDKLVQVWEKQIRRRLVKAISSHVDGGFIIEFALVGKKQSDLRHTITVTCVDKKTKSQVEDFARDDHWLRTVLKDHDIQFMTFHANTALLAANRISVTETKPICELKFPSNSTTYCGAGLCAYQSENSSLMTSTVGGMILVDNKPYVLTAGHAFDTHPSLSREQDYAPNSRAISLLNSNDERNNDEDDDPMAVSAPCIFDGNDSPALAPMSSQNTASVTEVNHYEENHVGMTGVSHLHTYDAPHLVVDLLKIDNVKTEPLEIYHLSTFNGIHSEAQVGPQKDMDWMLLSVASNKLLPNLDRFGTYIDDVVDVPEQIRAVTIINPAGTTEDASLRGTLHPVPVFMNLFSKSYEVYRITTDFIWKPGTSGSWVTLDDKVCGQVIAGRRDVPWVYMISMQAILDDIQAELQALCVRIMPHEYANQSFVGPEKSPVVGRIVSDDAIQTSETIAATDGSSSLATENHDEHQQSDLKDEAHTTDRSDIRNNGWLTRGWTVQELLPPKVVETKQLLSLQDQPRHLDPEEHEMNQDALSKETIDANGAKVGPNPATSPRRRGGFFGFGRKRDVTSIDRSCGETARLGDGQTDGQRTVKGAMLHLNLPKITPENQAFYVPNLTGKPEFRSPPPRCRKCNQECSRQITKTSIRTIKAGRPYFKCVDCDIFVCFDDDIGDDADNPLCNCDVPSKRQITSAQKGRRIFFSCRTGACDFYKPHQRDGKDYTVSEDVADVLRALKIS